MPAIAIVNATSRKAPALVALAAGVTFAAFIEAKGIPTLRHDWNWPIDRVAISSFVSSSAYGWLSAGLGTPNPHPTTYLIALPLAAAMWLVGPFAALGMLCVVVGYSSLRAVASLAAHWDNAWPAVVGIGLFALFNPWVYNEVVAGHLVMVLAYAGLLGLFGEMLRGRNASLVRLALWIVLIEAQLQFFIVGMFALAIFAGVTRKWQPLLAGAIVVLPSTIGLIAERAALLATPYSVEWQSNQSVLPIPLLTLGGYFAGYAGRLGFVASAAVAIVLALAIAGAVLSRRSRIVWAAPAAIVLYAFVSGVHGPLAAPYAWIVRNIPESGVFRELYDLAGVFAALLAVLACAATAAFRPLGYAALAAGIALPISWAFAPPSALWIASNAYPHPVVATPPFARVALLPAFQPLGLRNDGGDGADPDAYAYGDRVTPLNEYFPTYPVDMALARYEQSGNADDLRALGVAEIVPRPWLVSRMRGGIGLAASSLEPPRSRRDAAAVGRLDRWMPLVAQCDRERIVDLGARFGACDLFAGDVGDQSFRPVVARGESIDSQSAWIDARLAFVERPALAQPLGGALTQSALPFPVEPNSWLVAYVRGALFASDGTPLAHTAGSFVWAHVPTNVALVRCLGLCELVAQTVARPVIPARQARTHVAALHFRRLAPWLYVVGGQSDSAALLRFNERYDSGWLALNAGRVLRHVRVAACVNGWFLEAASGRIVLVQIVAVLQLIAEVVGICCVVYLLKALATMPTKRVR